MATLLKWDKESDDSLYFITSAGQRLSVCLFSSKNNPKSSERIFTQSLGDVANGGQNRSRLAPGSRNVWKDFSGKPAYVFVC